MGGLFTLEPRIHNKSLERETGIEPATNGLGSRYSTIELLPLHRNYNVHPPRSKCSDT
jgi:hypothetical protein